MFPNYEGLMAVALSVVVGMWFRGWLANNSTRQRGYWLLGCFVLSIPSLLSSIYYLHVLPERAWFYEFRSWPSSEFSVLFLGAFFGCLATWIPARYRYYVWCTLFCISEVPYVKPFIAPLNADELTARRKGNAVMQSTLSTCGPASICNLLEQFGLPSNERDIAQAAHTYGGGTEAWYLARYVRSRGLSAKFVFGKGFHPGFGLPAMIGVTPGHFIAVLKVEGGEVHYVDPLQGAHHQSLKNLVDSYSPTGFHLVIGR